MKFRAKKVYGQSKTVGCPFCNRIATQKNKEGLDVCYRHSKDYLQEIKCACGSWLEQRSGKFGPYFNCLNCGNINFKKGLEIKALLEQKTIAENKTITENKAITEKKAAKINLSLGIEEKHGITEKFAQEKKEITITSNDVEYFS